VLLTAPAVAFVPVNIPRLLPEPFADAKSNRCVILERLAFVKVPTFDWLVLSVSPANAKTIKQSLSVVVNPGKLTLVDADDILLALALNGFIWSTPRIAIFIARKWSPASAIDVDVSAPVAKR
jgi:hypothetical protein